MLRNLFILTVLVAGALLAHALYRNTAPATPPALPGGHASVTARALAPDFSFRRLDGGTGNLADFAGKTVLLNFWASWCAPCRVEFPQFIALAKARPDDVVVLAVSVDHDRRAMARFLDGLGPDLRQPNIVLAHDPDKTIAQDLFGTLRYPETVLIGPDGTLRRKYVGLEVKWDDPAFIASLTP